MGLDMYIHSAELMHEVNGEFVPYKLGNSKFDEFYRSNVVEIRRNVAYWRKANQIHRWFVNNIQSSNDDCKEYLVSAEKLAEIVDLCERILSAQGIDVESFEWNEEFQLNSEAMAIAKKELPVQSGFFFGDTSYGGSYIGDLVATVQQLKPLVKSEMDFYYSSSW